MVMQEAKGTVTAATLFYSHPHVASFVPPRWCKESISAGGLAGGEAARHLFVFDNFLNVPCFKQDRIKSTSVGHCLSHVTVLNARDHNSSVRHDTVLSVGIVFNIGLGST
jgi:hypothetical protein